VAKPTPSRAPSRSVASLLLSRVDRYASRPLAAVFAVTAAGAWIIVSIVAGFPARWETVFQTVVAALTLAMLFVIQHTQARHQRATQRKLDEILQAIPGADNTLLTLEHASDDELHATGHQHRSVRRAALKDEAAAPSLDGAAVGGPAQHP
jgi:low affinity Fe/Cu permease